jgi:hypothetical protein
MRTSRMQALVPLASSGIVDLIEGGHARPSGCPRGQRLAELPPHLRASPSPRLLEADILRPAQALPSSRRCTKTIQRIACDLLKRNFQ